MILANRHGSIPRRTIDELATRYALEPELKDLFVEGPRDGTIYRWFLRQFGCTGVDVFEIDTVEITVDTLDLHGIGGGHRNRLIALALELDNKFPAVLPFVRCVADSDFDFILESRYRAKHLLSTDYTSIDLYTYDLEQWTRILCLGFKCSESCAATLFDSMTTLLLRLFIVRAANERLHWRMKLPNFIKCCSIQGSRIEFDREQFVTRCLNSNGRHRDRTAFEDVCNELQAVILDDRRKGIHGNDYIELLGWFLRKHRKWRGYARGERSILTVLLPSLRHQHLSNEGLFIQLKSIFGN